MNKTDIAYLRGIRYFPSFKTNALWFIILLIFNENRKKDKLASIKRRN